MSNNFAKDLNVIKCIVYDLNNEKLGRNPVWRVPMANYICTYVCVYIDNNQSPYSSTSELRVKKHNLCLIFRCAYFLLEIESLSDLDKNSNILFRTQALSLISQHTTY